MHRILILSFFAAAVATPAFIIGRSIRAHQIAYRQKSRIVGRALAALAIWFVLSAPIALVQFVVIFAAAHSEGRGAPIQVTSEFVVENVLYLLAMCGLAFWIWPGEASPR
jgi:hypothetical protein